MHQEQANSVVNDVLGLSRASIIEILEGYYSQQCYEEDTTDELRESLIESCSDPCMDGVLCEHSLGNNVIGTYWYYQAFGKLPDSYDSFEGKDLTSEEISDFREWRPEDNLIMVEGADNPATDKAYLYYFNIL